MVTRFRTEQFLCHWILRCEYYKRKLLDFIENFSTAKLTISRLNKRVYLHKNHLHHQMFQRNKKKNSRIFIIRNLMFAFTVFHNTILKHYVCGATLHTSRTTRIYFIFKVHCYGVIVSCQKQSICSVFISIFTLNFLFLDWMNGMVMWTGSHCICHIVQRCCCNNHKLFIFTIKYMKLFDFRLTISVSSLFG